MFPIGLIWLCSAISEDTWCGKVLLEYDAFAFGDESSRKRSYKRTFVSLKMISLASVPNF